MSHILTEHVKMLSSPGTTLSVIPSGSHIELSVKDVGAMITVAILSLLK